MVAIINPTTFVGAPARALRSAAPYADDVVRIGMQQKKAARGSAAPTQLAAKPTISRVDTMLEGAERATNIMGMAPFLAMPLGALGKGVSWVGSKTNIKPLNWVGSGMGAPGSYLARDAGETVVGKPVVAASEMVANASATVVGGVSRRTGLDGFLQRRHAGKVETHLERAREKFAAIPMAEVPDGLRSHVSEMRGIAHGSGPLSNHQVGRLETLLAETEKFEGKASKAFKKPFGKASRELRQAASHHSSAGHWADVEKGIRAAPGKLRKMDTAHVAMNSAFVAGSAISMASDARDFTKNLGTLKEMYFDLTGKKASTFGLLFGKVPPVIASARLKLVEVLAIKQGTDAIGMAVNLKGLMNPHFGSGIKAIAAYMIPGLIGSTAESFLSDASIPAYRAMKESFNPNAPMPAEYYANYLGELSTDLKKRGGAGSKFTQAVAAQYAAEHATPEAILREINSGALDKRIKALIAAASQQPHPAEAKKTPRAVIGKHTANEMKRDAAVPPQPGHAVT